MIYMIYMMVRNNEASIDQIMEAFKPLEGKLRAVQLGYKYLRRGICMHNLDPESGANCG